MEKCCTDFFGHCNVFELKLNVIINIPPLLIHVLITNKNRNQSWLFKIILLCFILGIPKLLLIHDYLRRSVCTSIFLAQTLKYIMLANIVKASNIDFCIEKVVLVRIKNSRHWQPWCNCFNFISIKINYETQKQKNALLT